MIFDFVPSAVLFFRSLPAIDANVYMVTKPVGGIRQPPTHHKEGCLDAFPIQQIQQTGNCWAALRLAAYEHIRFWAIIERQGNQLLAAWSSRGALGPGKA